ncbi:MAG: hypothetical protein HS126_19905 [Anaerolineales bacterium]|nr:hypothetical protein [Anaerolineales bacterium]
MQLLDEKLWQKSSTLQLQRVKGKKQMLSIFIVSSHLMFSRGLESLLSQDNELKIIGQETDVKQAIKQIKELRPDVVIVYGDETRGLSPSLIIEILNIHSGTKVISLSLQNNIFHVYQTFQKVALEPEDLFKAIKSRPLPEVPKGVGQALNRQIH